MIANLRLQGFRSYADASFEFEPGVNIIVGPNGSGKTNLLESILVLAQGMSYRVKDTELLGYDQPWSRLDALSATETRSVKLELQASGSVKKSYVINDQPFVRLGLNKTIPVILFEPNHLQLLIGSPDLRREYMDQLLEQTEPGFGQLRRHYRRALTQRNSLLKHGTSGASQLFAWNIRLSQLGGQIAEKRLGLMTQINEQLEALYIELAQKPASVQLHYKSSCSTANYGSSLLHKLEQATELDMQRGFTAYGPHRDDWWIELNDHPAETTASRGETRSLLLALKIIEMRIVESIRNQPPLLLLDDVFSELDGARRKALTEALKDHQTFITTTDADVVIGHFLDNCNVIAL